MDLSAPHIGFVIASYLVSAAAILALIIGTLMKLKVQERRLADLEVPGRRRGGAADEP